MQRPIYRTSAHTIRMHERDNKINSLEIFKKSAPAMFVYNTRYLAIKKVYDKMVCIDTAFRDANKLTIYNPRNTFLFDGKVRK